MDTKDKLRRLAAGAGDLIVAALNLTNEQDVAYVKGVSRTAFLQELENAYNLDRRFGNLPWIRSSERVPVDGQYLIYYEESEEYRICELNGRVFSYTYFKDGEEMVCELYPNHALWWCALKFNQVPE